MRNPIKLFMTSRPHDNSRVVALIRQKLAEQGFSFYMDANDSDIDLASETHDKPLQPTPTSDESENQAECLNQPNQDA